MKPVLGPAYSAMKRGKSITTCDNRYFNSIAETPHDHHSVSNRRQLDRLFKTLANAQHSLPSGKSINRFTFHQYRNSLVMTCVLLQCNWWHCNDDIMGAMASQITSLTIVYSTVYSGTGQRKHQSTIITNWGRGKMNGISQVDLMKSILLNKI